jgi:hypothetical protein
VSTRIPCTSLLWTFDVLCFDYERYLNGNGADFVLFERTLCCHYASTMRFQHIILVILSTYHKSYTWAKFAWNELPEMWICDLICYQYLINFLLNKPLTSNQNGRILAPISLACAWPFLWYELRISLSRTWPFSQVRSTK